MYNFNSCSFSNLTVMKNLPDSITLCQEWKSSTEKFDIDTVYPSTRSFISHKGQQIEQHMMGGEIS